MEIDTVNVWLAGAALAFVTAAQWVLLRSRYLAGLGQQRLRHAQQIDSAQQCLDGMRRQIAQLQADLASARSQLVRLTPRPPSVSPAAAAARAPDVVALSQSAPATPAAPVDGFADTLPAQQYPHDPALLGTYPGRR